MSATHTRTHVYVEFANPYLQCDQCDQRTTGFHDADRCGCAVGALGEYERTGYYNLPCGHRAGVTSVCPSWSPVDGCCCADHLGYVPHGPVDAVLDQGGDTR